MNTPNGSIANTSLSLRPLTLAWQSRNNITGSKWWRLPQWRFHSIPVKGRACTAPQAETTECVHRPSLRGLLNYIVTKCYENLCDELHKILYWVSFRRVRSDDSNDSITTRALTSCMWTRPRFVTTLYSWCRKMIGGSWLSNFFSGNISRRYRRAARVLLTTCSALNKKYRPTVTNNCTHQTITSNEIIPSHFYAECFATDSSLLYVTSSVLLMKTVIWYHSFQLTTHTNERRKISIRHMANTKNLLIQQLCNTSRELNASHTTSILQSTSKSTSQLGDIKLTFRWQTNTDTV